MTNTKTYGLTFGLILVLVACMSVLSAQTFIVGKTYDYDFSNLINSVDLVVTCGTNTLATTSLSDGTYAVGFEVEECNGTDAVSISATKGSATSSNTGILQIDADTFDYYAVINLQMIEPTPTPPSSSSSSGGSSSGGGSYRYFRCGNGKCDTGESANTCPADCTSDIEPLSTGITGDDAVVGETDLSGLEPKVEPKSSGITGSVIGYAKTKKGIGLIFALVIIVTAIGILAKRK